MSERVTLDELIARLGALASGNGPFALAFDGDGTLWSGDVAEDVFHFAVEHDLIRSELAALLEDTARNHGLAVSGSPRTLAAEIFRAYLEGRFPEPTVCEVMTWCFAGYTLAELRAMAEEALLRTQLDLRVRRELTPLFEYCRANQLRIVVISASPVWIVEAAAERWQIAPADIAAIVPVLDGERVLPQLALPLPYDAGKVVRGRALIGEAEWLASFGDSAFDLPMLAAAKLGVAVHPKPSLSARLAEVPGAVVLAV